jgi:hypothetical protein
MDDSDDDMPLAAKLLTVATGKASKAVQQVPMPPAAAKVRKVKKSSDSLTGGGNDRLLLPLLDDAQILGGPLSKLHQDLLLNIYCRVPHLVVRHSRVCKYFHRVLACCQRIHVELSGKTPCRLNSGLSRFVTGSDQQLTIILNDCTAMKPLLSVLECESTRASVIQIILFSVFACPVV